ncbi:MAG: hypothetical protein IPO91_28455 [Chloroflexi bacterium]|nr:hypothetical protein [Chloroflexota bacterium]
MMIRRSLLFAALVLLAACSSENTPVPTASLIPATATDVPTAAPPTTTPAGLPAPADLVPTHTATPASGEALIAQDPVAASLVGIAQREIAQELDLPQQRVQLVEVLAVTWTDSALNCPLPEQTATPMEVGGYRILLEAGEREYVFHTDFDRVVRCDPANEALPTAENTPEITPETTP